MGSLLGDMYSASCTQVIILSPEASLNPSAQFTYTSVPFFTGNTASVLSCIPVGNPVQVPGVFYHYSYDNFKFMIKFQHYK